MPNLCWLLNTEFSGMAKGESISIGIPGDLCAVKGESDTKQNLVNGETSGFLLGSI
jgi:hypothetical protein